MAEDMDIEVDVSASIKRVKPRLGDDFDDYDYDEDEDEDEDDDEGEDKQRALFQIGFLLKDTLKIFGEDEDEDDDKVEMQQCCYELEIITIPSSQVRDKESFKGMVYSTLVDDMYMDPQAAEKAKTEVVSTITDTIESTEGIKNLPCTIFMEVQVDCLIKKHGNKHPDEPKGQHGYAQLRRRVKDNCGVCQNKCKSPKDVIVTTCHHVYHRSCIFQWLNPERYSCPMCRSKLGPMVGLPIEFP